MTAWDELEECEERYETIKERSLMEKTVDFEINLNPKSENITLKSFKRFLERTGDISGEILTLTGRAPIWAYLLTFHKYAHNFKEVRFVSPRDGEIVICVHRV